MKTAFCCCTLLFLAFLIPSILFSQDSVKIDRQHDIKTIISVYEKNVVPYIQKFGKLQVKPLPKNANEAEVRYYESEEKLSIGVHEDNFYAFGRKLLKIMLEKEPVPYSEKERKRLLDNIQLMYRSEFLYLDYEFFCKSKSEIEEIFEKRKPG